MLDKSVKRIKIVVDFSIAILCSFQEDALFVGGYLYKKLLCYIKRRNKKIVFFHNLTNC
jgi:hypothetical protein